MVGVSLPCSTATQVLDAHGAYITPGGIDSHVHLSQFYDAAISNDHHTICTDGNVPDPENFTGDTYNKGTRSAIAGGTTTIISFASQMRADPDLTTAINEYHKLAAGKAYCDYAFHVVVTNPTEEILATDLRKMVEDFGITSVQIYMTHKSLMLRDYQVLGVIFAARKSHL